MNCMKKGFLIFAELLLFVCGTFASGFGLSGTVETGKDFSGGFTVDFEADGFPFIFEGEVLFCDEGTKSACGGIEFLAGNFHVYKALNFFYTPEIVLGYDFVNESLVLSNAFYIGLNGFVFPKSEAFIQGGWKPQILFGKDDVDFNLINFPIRLGLRFWTN